MRILAERTFDFALLDVAAVADGYVITTHEGQVEVVDTRLATVRVLRTPEGDWEDDPCLFPGGIAAIDDEVIVLVGHEEVTALALSSGDERWSLPGGDHSLDDTFGGCRLQVGAYALLPNGMPVRISDGSDPFDSELGDFAAALAERDAVLLAREDGAIERWVPGTEGVTAYMRLPTPARVMARAANDELVCVCRDGSILLAERVLAPPLPAGAWLLEVALAGAPRIAAAVVVEDAARQVRSQLFVDSAWVDAVDGGGHCAVTWFGDELVAILNGALRGTDLTEIQLSRRIDDRLVVADERQTLRVLVQR